MSLHGLPASARAMQEDGEEGNAMTADGEKDNSLDGKKGRSVDGTKGTIHPS